MRELEVRDVHHTVTEYFSKVCSFYSLHIFDYKIFKSIGNKFEYN